MLQPWQTTLKSKVSLLGKGLHTGRMVNLEILPAPTDHGIRFVRSDIDSSNSIEASFENISSTDLSTTIGPEQASISTIEHLMAAFQGCGVSNALVKINGPEIPILDGSALPYIREFKRVGFKTLRRPQMVLKVIRSFEYRSGDQFITVLPSDRQRIKCSIDFDHKLIGYQSIDYRPDADQFANICAARTFCQRKDVERMRECGLALGGSLDNAVVVDEDKILNHEGLRAPTEFVQHKLLDLIGDLSLLKAPVWGDIIAHKPGHRLQAEFMRALASEKDPVLELVRVDSLLIEDRLEANTLLEPVLILA